MKYISDSKIIIEKYSNMIQHIALRYLDCKDDADDIVQEVFLKYINFIGKGKYFKDAQHEKYWIIRVTLNICCNEINSARNRKNIPLTENISLKLDMSPDNFIFDAINKLSIKYRKVFELFYVNDFSIAEISAILKISEANVKTRLKRARDKVKEYMEKGENI